MKLTQRGTTPGLSLVLCSGWGFIGPNKMADDSLSNRKKRRLQWWKERKNHIKPAKGIKKDTGGQKYNENTKKQNLLEEIKPTDSSELCTLKSKRYILFIGNLPYDVSKEDVMSHFHKCGVPALDFRLMTDKASSKSKGCGFLELKDAKMLHNALKLNNSRMKSRCIKVEMSCGGGGKGRGRTDKIREKNRKLKHKSKLTSS